MATLSEGGRIMLEDVEAEIARLRHKWIGEQAAKVAIADALNYRAEFASPNIHDTEFKSLQPLLKEEEIGMLEPLELVQLAEAVRVCAISRTMAEAGRRLFKPANIRHTGYTCNYSDRMRKYLHRYHLNWETLTSTLPPSAP